MTRPDRRQGSRPATGPGHLLPLWWRALAAALLLAVTTSFIALAIVAEPPIQIAMTGAATGFLLIDVAAAVALGSRRRPRDLRPSADGSLVITASPLVTYPLLVAWLVLVVTAVALAWTALTDFASIQSPGAAGVFIVAAACTLPDLVRLATGRLHRWRLRVDAHAVTYQGYRTNITIPWSRLHGADIRPGGNAPLRAAIRLDRKGAGNDPTIPILPFTIDPSQIAHEINKRRPS